MSAVEAADDIRQLQRDKNDTFLSDQIIVLIESVEKMALDEYKALALEKDQVSVHPVAVVR